ncbi:hypothetical protein TSACC_3309 [Terrimicrobium sacchariphilum]|uniref:Uncharacterized protein n=1 Tax=Terrimicrobium sacchariphilum TaxID=690879 RepID=A0A146GCE6_TERSA|nr:hypothetical protein TSACC_3309 [Terrimicrobium sacchariphilum]
MQLHRVSVKPEANANSVPDMDEKLFEAIFCYQGAKLVCSTILQR